MHDRQKPFALVAVLAAHGAACSTTRPTSTGTSAASSTSGAGGHTGAATSSSGGGGGSGSGGGPVLSPTCPTPGACSACTAHLDHTLQGVDPAAVGSCISTYGANIATSNAQRASLKQLGLKRYRVPIRWNNGNPVSSAGGGPQNISADGYIQALAAIGASAILVVGGDTGDNDFTPDEAAKLVAHYSPMGVKIYYLGNEPNNKGISITTYANLFNQAADQMKAVDPGILVGGPTWSYFDMSTLGTFVDLSGGRADIIDYHHYGMGNPPALMNDAALAQTKSWGDEVQWIHQMLAQKGFNDKPVSVGEYNWAWQYMDGMPGGDQRFYQPIITVWAASVIGHVLSSGGAAYQYSDQNGPLGLTIEAGSQDMGKPGSSPMPIYHGLGMWSGESAFRGYGTSLLEVTCDDPAVEIYATTGPNVLLINKSNADKGVVLGWSAGAVGSAAVWQTNAKDPYAPPSMVAMGHTDPSAHLYVGLPAMSVATVVMNP
jgi:hypothetical protein